MNKKYAQWFWFIGGFALGFTLISIGHAALPKKAVATPVAKAAPARGQQTVSELRASKAGTPELEDDFNKLSKVESKYAESSDQQKKLKMATSKSARKSQN